ncbi:MAG: recombinase family protein [Alishewanella aestuarii]
MTRSEHQQHRQAVLTLVYSQVIGRWKIPSYRKMTAFLNQKEIRTNWGNPWTEKSLFRFLQNAGYSGLWGLKQLDNAPALTSEKIVR